jgi:hypothetical protein
MLVSSHSLIFFFYKFYKVLLKSEIDFFFDLNRQNFMPNFVNRQDFDSKHAIDENWRISTFWHEFFFVCSKLS